MDGPELDLSIVELIQDGLKKRNRRKITKFIQYLAGGDSPIEAMELTLRRNVKLREAELRTVSDIVKIVEKPKDGEVSKLRTSFTLQDRRSVWTLCHAEQQSDFFTWIKCLTWI